MNVMTVPQVEKEYGLPRPVVYWLASSGMIPTHKAGKTILFDPTVTRRRMEEMGIVGRDTTTYPEAEAV